MEPFGVLVASQTGVNLCPVGFQMVVVVVATHVVFCRKLRCERETSERPYSLVDSSRPV